MKGRREEEAEPFGWGSHECVSQVVTGLGDREEEETG